MPRLCPQLPLLEREGKARAAGHSCHNDTDTAPTQQKESSGLGPYLLTPPFGEEQHQLPKQPPFDSRVRFLHCLYSLGRIAAFGLLAIFCRR